MPGPWPHRQPHPFPHSQNSNWMSGNALLNNAVPASVPLPYGIASDSNAVSYSASRIRKVEQCDNMLEDYALLFRLNCTVVALRRGQQIV